MLKQPKLTLFFSFLAILSRVHVEDALVDCLDGYRFVLEKLPSLVQESWPVGTKKGITIDPKRVVVVGFSAGAHLAICMVSFASFSPSFAHPRFFLLLPNRLVPFNFRVMKER